jgi:hypothetical protein
VRRGGAAGGTGFSEFAMNAIVARTEGCVSSRAGGIRR